MTGGPLPSRRTELDETADDPVPPARAAGPEELTLANGLREVLDVAAERIDSPLIVIGPFWFSV